MASRWGRVVTWAEVSAWACGNHLGLGEVDDVERRLVGGEQRLDRLVQRRAAVLEVERYGSRR